MSSALVEVCRRLDALEDRLGWHPPRQEHEAFLKEFEALKERVAELEANRVVFLQPDTEQ